jgi:hypothetical protein
MLLYGSDVQLYNEKAFQNNIKSIYMYTAHGQSSLATYGNEIKLGQN